MFMDRSFTNFINNKCFFDVPCRVERFILLYIINVFRLLVWFNFLNIPQYYYFTKACPNWSIVFMFWAISLSNFVRGFYSTISKQFLSIKLKNKTIYFFLIWFGSYGELRKCVIIFSNTFVGVLLENR